MSYVVHDPKPPLRVRNLFTTAEEVKIPIRSRHVSDETEPSGCFHEVLWNTVDSEGVLSLYVSQFRESI